MHPFPVRTSPWFLCVTLTGAACDSNDALQTRGLPAFSITAPAEASATTQHVMVKSLADGSPIIASSSTLKRRSDQLTVRVHTRGLDPTESVDVFWAVFNNPAACENPNPLTGAPCSPPDLFIPATAGSLHFVATLTADHKGRLSYSATLAAGSSAGCIGGPFPCTTLTNAAGAEVHSAMFVPDGGPGRQAAQFFPE